MLLPQLCVTLYFVSCGQGAGSWSCFLFMPWEVSYPNASGVHSSAQLEQVFGTSSRQFLRPFVNQTCFESLITISNNIVSQILLLGESP